MNYPLKAVAVCCAQNAGRKNIAQYTCMYSLEDYGQPAYGTEESSAEKQLFIYLFRSSCTKIS